MGEENGPAVEGIQQEKKSLDKILAACYSTPTLELEATMYPSADPVTTQPDYDFIKSIWDPQ